jgi:hypothetical protein
VSAYRTLDGAAQESAGGLVTELGNGQYLYEGVAADFNANFTTALLFTAADSIPVHVLLQMQYFRKDTAYNIPFLLINVNTSQGLTGATPAGKRCLDGGGQESVAGSFTELGNGQYVFEATVADFDADDIVGFLITATNAVPLHIIIDLLESYSPTALTGDTPATIVAAYLTGLALMTVPSAAGDWPLYISFLPDGPGIAHNAGAIYNTTPIKDGRWLKTGAVFQHYGIQIMLRATSEEAGWDKCKTLAGQLDAVANNDVIVSGTTYRLHNISRVGGINSLGEEPGTKRRRLFSMNFMAAIAEL